MTCAVLQAKGMYGSKMTTMFSAAEQCAFTLQYLLQEYISHIFANCDNRAILSTGADFLHPSEAFDT